MFRKLFITLLFICSIFMFVQTAEAGCAKPCPYANCTRSYIAKTGAGPGAVLDAYDGDCIKDGDVAIVTTKSDDPTNPRQRDRYTADTDCTSPIDECTADGDKVIVPLKNPGNKRWMKTSPGKITGNMTVTGYLNTTGDLTTTGTLTIPSNNPPAMSRSTLTQNSDLVIVGPDDRQENGTLEGCSGGCTTGQSYLNIGHSYRIRQTGTIERVKFYLDQVPTTQCSELQFEIWRSNYNNNGTVLGGSNPSYYTDDTNTDYSLVNTSDNEWSNIVTNCAAGGACTIDLTTDITGVQRGDYIGAFLKTSGATDCRPFSTISLGANETHLHETVNTVASGSAYDWHGQTQTVDTSIPIEVYMQAPILIVFGDSIAGGSNDNKPFLQGATGSSNIYVDLAHSVAYHLGTLNGWSYQNLGIAGETPVNADDRFILTSSGCTADSCGLDIKPKVAVIISNHNATGTIAGRYALAAAYETMLDECDAEDVICIVVGMTPWDSGTTIQMRQKDTFNMTLSEVTSGHDNAIFVDVAPYVAQNRTSGDDWNLWDYQVAYAETDDLHLNTDGYEQIAIAINDAYTSFALKDSASTTPIMALQKRHQGIGFNAYPLGGKQSTTNPEGLDGYGATVKGKLKVSAMITTGIMQYEPDDLSPDYPIPTSPVNFFAFNKTISPDSNNACFGTSVDCITLPSPTTFGYLITSAYSATGPVSAYYRAVVLADGSVNEDGTPSGIEYQSAIGSCVDTLCFYDAGSNITLFNDTAITYTVQILFWYD